MNPHWTGGRRSSFFSIHRLTNRLGQLIRTRGGLEPTADAFQTLDHFFRLHAFDETAHPLRIAITASIELHVVNNPVNDFEFNHLTAGTLRIISVFHSEIDLAAKVRLFPNRNETQILQSRITFIAFISYSFHLFDDLILADWRNRRTTVGKTLK